jgi:HTH-type transcriptional regulator/antitoxin HigA
VKAGDGMILDEENGETLGDEKATNELAASWLFPEGLAIPETTPRQGSIDQAARLHGVHPIVVVGRLQKLGPLDWRTSLAKGAPTVIAQMETW